MLFHHSALSVFSPVQEVFNTGHFYICRPTLLVQSTKTIRNVSYLFLTLISSTLLFLLFKWQLYLVPLFVTNKLNVDQPFLQLNTLHFKQHTIFYTMSHGRNTYDHISGNRPLMECWMMREPTCESGRHRGAWRKERWRNNRRLEKNGDEAGKAWAGMNTEVKGQQTRL